MSTSRFAELWDDALAKARQRGTPHARSVADRVARPSFPGAIAMLAGPGRKGGGMEFRAPQTDDTLQRLVGRRGNPAGVPDELARVAVRNALEREGIAVTEAELTEVVTLLRSGRFLRDLQDSAAAVFEAVPAVPRALLADAKKLPTLLPGIPVAVANDVIDLPATLTGVMQTLLARLHLTDPSPSPIELQTLATVYDTRSVGNLRRLLATLLHRDNRSVRLALILYARSHGWKISDADIDTVYDNLVVRDPPDLGPVFDRALTVTADHYGAGHLDQLAFLLPVE